NDHFGQNRGGLDPKHREIVKALEKHHRFSAFLVCEQNGFIERTFFNLLDVTIETSVKWCVLSQSVLKPHRFDRRAAQMPYPISAVEASQASMRSDSAQLSNCSCIAAVLIANAIVALEVTGPHDVLAVQQGLFQLSLFKVELFHLKRFSW
ncbi:MAG: hypothetical protein EZS28_043092, partial [Streblomastix strix]